MKKRSHGRLLALQALYCYTVAHTPLEELLQFRWMDTAHSIGEQQDANQIRQFAVELAKGTLDHLRQIDGAISHAALHWDIDRMMIIDRSLLRIGSYEILYRSDIPAAVTINEMVELAKRYGGTNSASFVNGVLDKIQANISA